MFGFRRYWRYKIIYICNSESTSSFCRRNLLSNIRHGFAKNCSDPCLYPLSTLQLFSKTHEVHRDVRGDPNKGCILFGNNEEHTTIERWEKTTKVINLKMDKPDEKPMVVMLSWLMARSTFTSTLTFIWNKDWMYWMSILAPGNFCGPWKAPKSWLKIFSSSWIWTLLIRL